jgi:hypothetical protein
VLRDFAVLQRSATAVAARCRAVVSPAPVRWRASLSGSSTRHQTRVAPVGVVPLAAVPAALAPVEMVPVVLAPAVELVAALPAALAPVAVAPIVTQAGSTVARLGTVVAPWVDCWAGVAVGDGELIEHALHSATVRKHVTATTRTFTLGAYQTGECFSTT